MGGRDTRQERWQNFWGKSGRRLHGRFETNLANPLNDLARPRIQPVRHSAIYNALVHTRTAHPVELAPHVQKDRKSKMVRQRRDGHDDSYRPFPSFYLDFYPKDSGRDWGERGHEAADREQREAYPEVPLRSCYHQIVGDCPRNVIGRDAALIMLRKISEAIEKGGWTRAEQNRLYKMEKKWRARANGMDARYNVVGNRQGGLDAEERERVRVEKSFARIRRWQDGEGER